MSYGPTDPMYSINPSTGCWEWVRAISSEGYGILWDAESERVVYAHRHFYERFKGSIAERFDLDHLCRNRKCVNPNHLEMVPRKTNARRGRGTKLTQEQVEEIHRLNESGIGYRRLAKMFGVHRSTICHLITKRNWKDISV